MRNTHERGWGLVALAAFGVLLAVVGLVLGALGPAVPWRPQLHDEPATAHDSASSRSAQPAQSTARTGGRPLRVRIAALDIDAPVVGIALEGSVLRPPADPRVLGWWSGGAKPGATIGTALITGHTVHTGGGTFDDLDRLERGDRVRVATSRGAVDYRVRRSIVLNKDQLAARSPRLFSQSAKGRLVLVTCEGWNGASYDSNVVVVARQFTLR